MAMLEQLEPQVRQVPEALLELVEPLELEELQLWKPALLVMQEPLELPVWTEPLQRMVLLVLQVRQARMELHPQQELLERTA